MTDFILPDIGEGIVECELLQWKVSEGDVIKEDQVVAEVMTDKATVEIPAMHSGKVSKLYYKEGEIAKVHSPLFAMESANDESIHRDAKAKEAVTIDNHGQPVAHDTESLNSNSIDVSSDTANDNIESFVLPDIGEGIVECEIMQWHVSEGDIVSEDQVVVEVMTDKAIVEIPAKHAGKIVKLHYQKGDIAAVHSKLFDQALETDSKFADAKVSVSENPKAVSTSELETTSSEDSQRHKTSFTKADSQTVRHSGLTEISDSSKTTKSKPLPDNNKQGENFEPPVDIGKAIASPAVRRLARENDVELANIKASGAKGRVLKSDVLNAVNNRIEGSSVSLENVSSNKIEKVIKPTGQFLETKPSMSSDRVEPIKGVKAAMAKQMAASFSTIPHFSVSDELCMDKLIKLREGLKHSFASKDQKLSFMPFFVKALSLAMLEFPILNSRVNDDVTELTYLGAHNIGVAVDSKIGLLVPNIKNVESKSLFEVAIEFNQLVEKAREGKLSNQDLSKGTISISNVGAIGGITATPIINKPNVAIVALGKTQTLPRFKENGEVVASNMMTINWSADHRVIDGATMVKFNNLWMDYLSNPEKMLMHLR